MNLHVGTASWELTVSIHSELPAEWPSAGAAPDGVFFTIFQSREFIKAWMQSFGKKPRWTPHFVKVLDAGGAPLMLLPLCIEMHRGVRILSFLDQGHADYVGPVLFGAPVLTAEAMTDLWSRILDALPAVDIIRLEKIPPLIDAIPNPLRLFALSPDAASAHGNRLDQPWADVERSIEFPKQVRKKERALQRIARLDLLVADNAEQRANLLERLIIQKQQRFEEMRVAGYAEKPEHLAFLRCATSTFAASGNLLLCALTANDEAIAIQWALVQGPVVYALVNSHAGAPWSRFSCGRILNYRLIKLLHERGYRYFDQGFGDEAYKLNSSDTTIPLACFEEARSVKGRLYLYLRQLRAAARSSKLGAKLREAKWIMIRKLRGNDPAPRSGTGPEDAP